MKLRILTLTLILSFLSIHGTVSDGVQAQKAARARRGVVENRRWYVFVSPDGDFTLSFPQKPDREADGVGPASTIKSYGLYTQNGMRFSVNFQDGVGDPTTRLANEWDDRYEQALLSKYPANKQRVVQTQRIGKNTFEREIWDSSSNSGESINYIMQTILRQGRIYTLLCGSEIYGRPVDKSVCRRFFDSMHFIPNSAASRRL